VAFTTNSIGKFYFAWNSRELRLTLAFIRRAGVVYSGMGPDFRVLVKAGQKKARRRTSPTDRVGRSFTFLARGCHQVRLTNRLF